MKTINPRYYGWKITLGLAVTETISFGVILYAFSVYIVSFETQFQWNRAQISGALSFALLISALVALPVGIWLDKHGGRLLMTVGSTGAALLFLAFSQVDTLLKLYIVWGGLGIFMAMVFYDPAFTIVAKWFNKQRGAAIALVTVVAGFASTIFLPLTNWLLSSYGRAPSIIILAIILALGTIPIHALLLRRKPADLGLFVDGAESQNGSEGATAVAAITIQETLHNPQFWLLTGGFALAWAAGFGIRVHIIPLFLDRGLSPAFAASAAGIIGAMQVVGRLIYALLSDRLMTKHVAIGLLGLQIVAFAALLYWQTAAGIWLFIIILGLVQGTITILRPIIVADLYGTENFGRINSIMAFAQSIAVTIAPFGIGFIYTRMGQSYDPVLLLSIFATLISVLAFSRLRS